MCGTDVLLLKSKLIITLNYEMSCPEFYTAVVQDKQLLSKGENSRPSFLSCT